MLLRGLLCQDLMCKRVGQVVVGCTKSVTLGLGGCFDGTGASGGKRRLFIASRMTQSPDSLHSDVFLRHCVTENSHAQVLSLE